jgi:putative FmdB family regulatory protein
MPTYEYRCEAGHKYEKRESFSAPARQKCQKCGKPALRVIFAPPVVFKGGGFYATDSRGGSRSDSRKEPDAASDSPVAAASSDGHGHGHSHGPDGHSHGSTDTADVDAAAT